MPCHSSVASWRQTSRASASMLLDRLISRARRWTGGPAADGDVRSRLAGLLPASVHLHEGLDLSPHTCTAVI